jgi:hypothetical protein
VRTYADRSFILRLVTGEADSPETIAEYRRLGSPNLLHVAGALALQCELFLTTDARQAHLAKAEGLKVVSVGWASAGWLVACSRIRTIDILNAETQRRKDARKDNFRKSSG